MMALIFLRQQDVEMFSRLGRGQLLGSVDDPQHCLPVLGCGACVPSSRATGSWGLAFVVR